MKNNIVAIRLNLLFSVFSFFIFSCVLAQVKVSDFYTGNQDKNDVHAIQKAFDFVDSVGHGSVEFDGTRNYVINETIQLPRYEKGGKRIIVINGNGCQLNVKKGIIGFQRKPKDQQEALNKMMGTRFVINDFTFSGGQIAIELCATYGSSVNRCNFLAQDSAAIDIQFGLNTMISQCHVTNPGKDAFVLRCGTDWGGNRVNSQSNHSVIEACRVYAKKGTESCFKILGSSGVVLRDIISEGSGECDYSVYFDRENSNVVRLFTVENFHLEHAPKKAGIYLNHTGIATVDGLFYQLAFKGFVLVKAAPNAEQVTLRNIPHYVEGTVICLGNNEVPFRVEYCHKAFYDPKTWCVETKDGTAQKLPFYFSGIGGKYQIKQNYGK